MPNHKANNVNKKKSRHLRAEISSLLNEEHRSENSTANSPSTPTASGSEREDAASSSKPENRDHPPPRRFISNCRNSYNRGMCLASGIAIARAPQCSRPNIENVGNTACSETSSSDSRTSDEEDHQSVEDTKGTPLQRTSAGSKSHRTPSVTDKSKPRRVTNDVPCDICRIKFYNQEAVERHKRLSHHRRIGSVTCPECGLILRSEENLARHSRIHGPGAEIRCTECSARFVRQRNLTAHMRQVHATTPLPQTRHDFSWICPFPGCEYASTQSNNITRHYGIIHEGHYPFECDLCDFRAAHRCNLESHRATHDK